MSTSTLPQSYFNFKTVLHQLYFNIMSTFLHLSVNFTSTLIQLCINFTLTLLQLYSNFKPVLLKLYKRVACGALCFLDTKTLVLSRALYRRTLSFCIQNAKGLLRHPLPLHPLPSGFQVFNFKVENQS